MRQVIDTNHLSHDGLCLASMILSKSVWYIHEIHVVMLNISI